MTLVMTSCIIHIVVVFLCYNIIVIARTVLMSKNRLNPSPTSTSPSTSTLVVTVVVVVLVGVAAAILSTEDLSSDVKGKMKCCVG